MHATVDTSTQAACICAVTNGDECTLSHPARLQQECVQCSENQSEKHLIALGVGEVHEGREASLRSIRVLLGLLCLLLCRWGCSLLLRLWLVCLWLGSSLCGLLLRLLHSTACVTREFSLTDMIRLCEGTSLIVQHVRWILSALLDSTSRLRLK